MKKICFLLLILFTAISLTGCDNQAIDDIKEVVCFNLFQIGELANCLSIEFIKEYNKIPWKQIIGMRNRIVHGYDTINLEIVWNTAIESIPELKSYCKEILG